MARITIRQLNDAVVARLRERAAAAGRSMEQEVREILTASCTDAAQVLSRMRHRQAAYGDRRFSDSADLVRAMRDQRAQ